VIMEHLTKTSEPRVRHECTLPLTGKGVVDRLITDLAVFDFGGGRTREMVLVEQLTDISLDELAALTEASFRHDVNLKATTEPDRVVSKSERSIREARGREAWPDA